MVDTIEDWALNENIQNIEFESNYQLNIEDAATISDKDLVIFIDASVENIKDFQITPVNSSTKVTFTSHAASPGYIVGLCRELYGKTPAVYLLHIKGYQWDFREGLSEKAKKNLETAADILKKKLRHPEKLINHFEKVNNDSIKLVNT